MHGRKKRNGTTETNSVQETGAGAGARKGYEGKDNNFFCLFPQITEYFKGEFSKCKIRRTREAGSSLPCSTPTGLALCRQYTMPRDNKPEIC